MIWAMLAVAGASGVLYHFDPIGQVAFAMQRGKLQADKEFLHGLTSKDVAGLEQVRVVRHVADHHQRRQARAANLPCVG